MKTTANIAGVKPSISGTLHLQGSDIPLTDSDFVQNSLAFKSGTSNGSEFSVGAAIIGECDFSFVNDSGKFSKKDWFDSRIQIYLTVDSTVLDMGYFYVVKHHELGNVVTVESYDILKILDEHALYELIQDYGLTFPCTVGDVLSALNSQHGFTISGCAGSSLPIDDPKQDQMTQRALISYLAQMSGQFVVAHGNTINFSWYDTNTVYDAGNTFSHDLRTDNITITGCKVTTDDNSTSEERGTAGYMLGISDNPFIDANNIVAVADLIYAAVGGISYRPGDFSIVANPAIDAGDVLSINTGQEQGVTVIATTLNYKPQLQQRITSDAEPYAGDLRISRSAYYKRQAKQAAKDAAKETISDDLKDSDSDLSKAIAGAGGKTRVINILQRGQAGTLSTNDTFTGFVMSSSGVSALNISSWTTEALKCYIMPQAIEVPSFDSITALLMATGDVVDNYPFKLRLKVKVNSYVGYIDVQAFYTTAGAGKVICIAIPSGTGTSGADQHGGTTVFTMARPSTGELTFVPFKMFGRTDQGYAFLYGVTDREWNVYQNAPSV